MSRVVTPQKLRSVFPLAAAPYAATRFDSRLARARFFDRAAACGKRVFVRSVFLQGVAHLGPHGLPPHLARLEPVLASISLRARASAMSTADAFLLYLRETLSAPLVIGMESDVQLEMNLRAWGLSCGDAAGLVAELAELVPELPESILDPSRWPTDG